LNPRPSGQMRALDVLGVAFAWAMHVGVQMPGVGAPMGSVVAGEPEGLRQRFELQKDLILAATNEGLCARPLETVHSAKPGVIGLNAKQCIPH
jgi:hypothetical protein